ncbi:DHA2 family efflux MFS transporter permease subunit [Bosea sp. CS1GBMeth4]|uniref:DHA2 family efflux MFS transporter permease subunit n=1 Tax=Bosea sp. CS1GBMeth4 TaxID=1892849 RepID=UPI0016471C22|nr:DHA2 family efflux MFS transporter permease subunit [Bosea sp. CS1GBMeth4]
MNDVRENPSLGPSAAAPSAAQKNWVLGLTSAASLMAALDAMVVATSLSTIRADFGASIEALQWTLNAYNLSFAVLLLTGAALGDRLGRKRMFIAGVALFVAASIVCALSGSAALLIAGRAAQGVGAALLMPLAMALLSAAFPPQERGKALGIFSGVTGLGIIAGPLIGGAISQGLAWQWIFWINLPIGLAIILLARRHVPESHGQDRAVDGLGVVLVTLAAFGLVWGILRGNGAGWASTEILTALIGGAALALLFIAWQRSAPQPMVPLRLFRSRRFAAGVGASFLFYAGMYGVVFFLPQFFQAAQGHGPLAAGLRLLPWTATLFFVAPIAGRLINRFGERRLVAGGVLLQALGFGWISLIAAPGLAFINLIAPLVIAGAGISMAMPAAQNAVLNAVDKPEIGKASGIFNMFRFLGGVCGIAVTVALFGRTGSLQSAEAFNAGFSAAIALSAALSLAAGGIALALPGRNLPTPVEASATPAVAPLTIASRRTTG